MKPLAIESWRGLKGSAWRTFDVLQGLLFSAVFLGHPSHTAIHESIKPSPGSYYVPGPVLSAWDAG